MNYLYILIISFVPFFLQAQNDTDKPNLKNMLEAGQAEFMDGQIEAALDIFSNALATENLPLDTITGLLYGWQGKALYYLQRDDEAFSPFKMAIDIFTKKAPNSLELAKFYVNIGGLYRWKDRCHEAIEHLEKALVITDKTPNDQILSVLFTELGANYRVLGDYAKSLEYQELAIPLAKKIFFQGSVYYVTALFEKGLLLVDLKDYHKARAVLVDALELIHYLPDDAQSQNLKRVILQAIAISHVQLDEWEEARKYYEEVSELSIDEDIVRMNNLVSLTSVATSQQNMDKAKKYEKEATRLATELLPSKSIDLAVLLQIKAKVQLAQGNYDSAFFYYQKEIIALTEDFEDTDIYSLPNIKSINQTLSIDKLSDVVALKARVFSLAYKSTNDIKYLKAALEHIKYTDRLADLMRKEYTSRGTKLFWSDLAADAFEVGIEICLELERVTKDNVYLNQAFYFSEKNKALLLLESFQNTRAMESSNIPKELLGQERNLRLDISDLEQEIRHLKEEKMHDATTPLNKELASKNEEYERLIKTLEKEYPQYYKAKYATSFATVDDVRKFLDPNQCLIEYFVGDSSTFIFKISKDDFIIKKISRGFNEVSRDAKKIIVHTTKYYAMRDRHQGEQDKWVKTHSQLLHEFYEDFIKPVEPLNERVVIIPSGALAELPFSSFLSEKPEDPNLFYEYEYLVYKYAFSYAFSATSWIDFCNRAPSNAPNTFLAFAPSFSGGEVDLTRGNRFELSQLTYNKPEVESLQKLLGGGTIFLDKEATEEKFYEFAPNYKVIHFSTHGIANRVSPDYSMLIFAQLEDSIENEYLYVRELYNTRLNADMVVLSACETGIGKLHRGEGVASLARGFSFAGAKSIFTTLWVVNDQATYQIVSVFYRFLKAGKTKDVALQLAQQDFLKRNVSINHAFCWAPFIMLGDTVQIQIAYVPYYFWFLGIGGVCLLVLGGWWLRNRFQKNRA